MARMTANEAETHIKNTYPSLMNKIDGLIDLCLERVTHIEKNQNSFIENNDARYTIYGKYISILNATRIGLYQGLFFIANQEWSDIYNKKFSIAGDENFIYLRELDTQHRFAFFIKFVSEFEASIKIIIYFLKKNGVSLDNKYQGFIINNLKLNQYSQLLDMARLIRNSIHNNGLYIPDNSTENINRTYKALNIQFNVGKRLDVTWDDFFGIANELILLTEEVFKHEIIEKEITIPDII